MLRSIKNLLGTWEELGCESEYGVFGNAFGQESVRKVYIIKEENSWTGDVRYRMERNDGTALDVSERYAEEEYKKLGGEVQVHAGVTE